MYDKFVGYVYEEMKRRKMESYVTLLYLQLMGLERERERERGREREREGEREGGRERGRERRERERERERERVIMKLERCEFDYSLQLS